MTGFDPDAFMALAPEMADRFYYHRELESTNDEAARLGALAADHGTLVLAEYQTRGRGRRGAAWLSDPGEGLTFSLVLRPMYTRASWCRVSLVAGLGIAVSLREQFAIPAEVKWPNDVLTEGGKCCGILVEAKDDFLVLGIGINVLGAPEECAALVDHTNGIESREAVLATLVKAIMREVNRCGDQFEAQLEIMDGISWLSGKQISFRVGESEHTGEVAGIGADGDLLVLVDGVLRSFPQASDIREL